ncbi:MAG: hypothetical protein JSS87_07145 [Acidobacteria bacterium]|nr:hypothetical protein [Acidobacteriota bacterium]
MFLLVLFVTVPMQSQNPKVRISAWYWLNSAPKTDWSHDFTEMRKLGFTDVLMCWGVDLTGIVTRKHDTLEAMDKAHKAGLGIYLIVWQPVANSMHRDPKFMQITAEGKVLDSFDVFNPEWRNTEWKRYLQDVAHTYRDVPGFRGYAFDDTFGGSAAISYGAWEEKAFGAPLPRTPNDARWNEWVKARNQWWEDWAIDTVRFIRDIDPNPAHVLYVEDSINSLVNPKRPALLGWDLGRTMKHFDAVGGYTVSTWTSDPNSPAEVAKKNGEAIKIIRKVVPGKPIIFTFWTANQREERLPGPAVHPTAEEIIAICQEALRLGVKHLDMYGYRIGEFKVTKEQMAQQMPPEPAPYQITGQFPQKFMWDRPELFEKLGKYLRSLNR